MTELLSDPRFRLIALAAVALYVVSGALILNKVRGSYAGKLPNRRYGPLLFKAELYLFSLICWPLLWLNCKLQSDESPMDKQQDRYRDV